MEQINKSPFTPQLYSVLKQGYGLADLRQDFFAGLTVAIVALPLALALSIASGAPPEKGLITAVVAGLITSMLGGSRVQIVGPTGAFVVIVFDVIARHGYDGMILAVLLSGLILICAGFSKLGQLVKYIPHPVITGVTAGIAAILATTQVRDLLGLGIAALPLDFVDKWTAYWNALNTFHFPSVCVGIGTLFTVLALQKLVPKLPEYLVGLALFSAIVSIFGLSDIATIGSRFSSIPGGLPSPELTTFSLEKIHEVLPAAFTIAFLAGVEALLSAVVADGMTGFRHRPNQELVSLGVANVGVSLFAGIPATGTIARTAANISAGGKTPFAGMFHALFLGLFMFFGMDLMKLVPMPALAAVLVVVAWRMSERHRFLQLMRLSGGDRAILLLTFGLTLFADLSTAIAVGVTMASLIFMARMSSSVEVSTGYKEAMLGSGEYQRKDLPKGVEAFWIAGPIFYGIAGDLPDYLRQMGRSPSVLIIRMRLVPYLDATGASALDIVVRRCQTKGTQVVFSAPQRQPSEMLDEFHLRSNWTHVHYTTSYEEAIELSEQLVGEP